MWYRALRERNGCLVPCAPDGTEIDAYYNVDNTAKGDYTVTVISMAADGRGFQSGGQPPSQNSGSGIITVLVGCPTSINVPSETQRLSERNRDVRSPGANQ